MNDAARRVYAAHTVEEVLILDPQERTVHWLALEPGGEYRPGEGSGVIGLSVREFTERLVWPQ